MSYNIILPKGYDRSNKKYPVIYNLHGRAGNLNTWNHATFLKDIVKYQIIIVLPDVGSSWYLNWSTGENNKWADYICQELIKHVDSNFKTISDKSGRGINGFSMGGFGALYLGITHPDLFKTVHCGAGGLRFIDSYRKFLLGEGPDPQARTSPTEEGTLKGLWPKGRLFKTIDECNNSDPFHLIRTVNKDLLPDLSFSVGYKDNLLESNINFTQLLLELKIPYSLSVSDTEHSIDDAVSINKAALNHQYYILTRK